MESFSDKVAFIWSVADLLRGDYKPHEYGRVILPLTVLLRLDATLAPTKAEVLARDTELDKQGLQNRAKVLERVAGVPFYNTSPLDFRRLLDDPEHIAANMRTYIAGFSPGAADVLVKYGFDEHIKRLDEARLLYSVVAKFADLDVAPSTVSNVAMGYVFEEMIRCFSEASNETGASTSPPARSSASWSTCCCTRTTTYCESQAPSGRCTTRPAARAGCSPWPSPTCAT